MLIVFDVVGTLFSLETVQARLKEQGLSRELLPLWFARLLQGAMAATLAGRYLPFGEVAEASLRQLLAATGMPEQAAQAVVPSLRELDPWPDAAAALERLRRKGHRLVALSNSSLRTTEGLLLRGGLRDRFDAVVSADEARASKPDPRPYRLVLERYALAPGEACMVAAHGWDILGADAVGMQTVWIDRLEKRWPFPGEAPGEVAAGLEGAADLIATETRR